MNPLLAMFITEARDLLESIGQGILALEENPGDPPVIQGIFRALHTLKGSSGIFEPELTHLKHMFHAGEDLLDAVRNHKLAFTSEMADRLLALVDLVAHYLGEMEAERFEASASADPCAELAVSLRRFLDADTPAAKKSQVSTPPPAVPEWVTELPPAFLEQARALARGGPGVLVRYQPDADCFFFGADPMLVIRQLPGLALLHLDPPPPPEETADPFQCALRAVMLTLTDDQEALQRHLAGEGDQMASFPLDALPPPPKAPPDGQRQRRLLHLLKDMGESLGFATPEDRSGRIRATLGILEQALIGTPWLEASREAGALAEKSADVAPLTALLGRVLATLAPPPPVERPPAPAATAYKPAPPPTEEGGAKVIKVDQSRIDRMLDLVGELVVAKNIVPFLAERAEKEHGSHRMAQEIMEFFGHIHRLTGEMQSAMMQVRMLPVMHVFQRFPRLVRDISRKLDKQVELVITGGETEADKNVVEGLSDPLIHLVRNSLDHGLEGPGERTRSGKSPGGTLHLTAFQESDRVIIEIQDDGRGIDGANIRRKAFEKGLIDEKQRDEMEDQTAIQLIFAPGFSTVDAVSDLSGRGVGMDAVKNAVEGMGGRVLLSSQVGQGTRIRLELPLSMAVTRVMLIEVQGALYGIPLNQVVETVRLPRSAIRAIKHSQVVTLREKIIPLTPLAQLLGLPSAATPHESEEVAVLVVKPGHAEVGLLVDEFNKGMDVILKPLEGFLAGVRGCAGGALLGDGRVLLVLNLQELL